MTISRAGFLKLCGSALGAIGFEGPSLLSGLARPVELATSPRVRFSWSDASPALFAAHLHSPFEMTSGDGRRARLILTAVVDGPSSHGFEQFSLLFQGAAETAPTHGTHEVRHGVLGGFDLFLVPIGPARNDRTLYEACVSRRTGGGL